MSKITRYVSLGLAAAAVGVLVFTLPAPKTGSSELSYQPRNTIEQDYSAQDAAEWLARRRVNPATGKLDPSEVLKARNEVNQHRMTKTSAALGLQWEQRGPDNIGGRTRTIFIDPANPQLLFAGSVSGGLYRSTTGGSSWELIDIDASNNAITYFTKTSNGDYYYSTGEGLHYFTVGGGSGGILGGGIFKSTDGGNTFSVLSTTQPTPNDRTAAWANISFVLADPITPDVVYAATNAGLRKTIDGGQTWTNPVIGSTVSPIEVISAITDMTVTSTGGVWFKGSNHIIYSPDGSPGSFTQISSATSGLPTNARRSRIAVHLTDPNYVYVVHVGSTGSLGSVHRSTDGGQSWSLVGTGTSSFNPFGTQGDYDLLLTVDPKDKDRILLGGVTLWSWSVSAGWNQVNSLFASDTNPFYVHADQHDCVFHPTNPDIIYVVNDGGIFRSANDGFTWTPVNANFVTLQLYSVVGNSDGAFLGGSQDNGTIGITLEGNTTRAGVRTPGIDYQVSSEGKRNMDGDGAYVDASSIVPGVLFKEMQHGILGRSENGGQSFESFYQFNRMDPQYISGTNTAVFAEFVAPFELWESNNDQNSTDSIKWKLQDASRSFGFASQNDTATRGTMLRPQTDAMFIPDSFRVKHGALELVSDASGNLTGDGSGTFNAATGEFVARFNNYFNLEVTGACDISYNAGVVVSIASTSKGVPFDYTIPTLLSSGDSVFVKDIIQGAFFMGLRTRTGFVGNTLGGLWMTRRPFDFTTEQPDWWHLAALGIGNAVTVMDVSKDGDVIWFGTSDGRIIRIDNLLQARSRESADIDNSNPDIVTTTTIAGTYSLAITSISIDPNNPNRVMFTLGNYSNNPHVYFSTNALSANPTFINKQGDLPSMPVYGSTINVFDGSQAIIGTEFGVYTTEDINATSVNWTQENNGLGNVPVFMVKQIVDTRGSVEGDTVYQGHIDLATHGRGFVRSTNLIQMNTIGVGENNLPSSTEAVSTALMIYPNPATAYITVDIELASRGEVTLVIHDMNGRELRRQRTNDVNRGESSLVMHLFDLASGNYIISAEGPGFSKTGRLLVK